MLCVTLPRLLSSEMASPYTGSISRIHSIAAMPSRMVNKGPIPNKKYSYTVTREQEGINLSDDQMTPKNRGTSANCNS